MPTILPSDTSGDSDPNTVLDQVAKHCQTFRVDRLPIVSAFCHKIGISQSINASINSTADIDAGTVVTAMILDTLSGRTPLYRFHEFFQRQDSELLLGREIAPERFTDDVLGRALDRLHNAGTMKVFTEISLKACRLFGVRTDQGHFDTTSVNLWGDYDGSTADGPAPHITYGYSKDKRPDLKQFTFSLLCIEGNIPLLGQVEDGNAADPKLNNENLQRVAKLIAENQIDRDNFLYVADCKLVNPPKDFGCDSSGCDPDSVFIKDTGKSITIYYLSGSGPVLEGDNLSISFLAEIPGITLTPESSTDLQNWTTDGVTLSEIGADNRRTASVARDAPERYLRLKVEN